MDTDRVTESLRGRISAARKAGDFELADEFKAELRLVVFERYVQRSFAAHPPTAGEVFRMVQTLETYARQSRTASVPANGAADRESA